MKARSLSFAIVVTGAFAAGALIPAPVASQQTAPPPEGAYIQIGYMKVAPGKGAAYLALERDLWKAVHKERIARGTLRSWALYDVRYPAGTEVPYNFVTINTVDKWKDLEDPGYPELFKKVHPTLALEDLSRRTYEARDQVRVDLLGLIDQVK